MNWRVPPLRSGGLILTWRCTCACRHCLYRCSPAAPAGWLEGEALERVLDGLSREPDLSGVHLAGGEAMLDPARLEATIRRVLAAGVSIDYLETNASWCVDEAAARAGFERLRRAGLGAVLISASLFHLEAIPLARTLTAVRAAKQVFGGGVIVWTGEALATMARTFDPDRTVKLADACAALGLDDSGLWRMHSYLHPSGRAGEALAAGLPGRPPEAFAGDACAATLDRTEHFHIDPEGRLFTGLCPGLAAVSAPDFHRPLDEDAAPLSAILRSEGPCGLLAEARAAGFTPRAGGYAGKCALCLDLRRTLAATGRWTELAPASYYD